MSAGTGTRACARAATRRWGESRARRRAGRVSLGVFAAVMAAAFLHAAWNAIVKIGVSKIGTMVVLSVASVPIGLAVVAGRPLPGPEVWPWLLASALIHLVYKLFLALAYEAGDLSRVYPIARGAAPLMVLVASVAFLPDRLSLPEMAGVVLMGAGLVAMARGVFTSGESRRLLPFALGSAGATAGYTLVDGLGARVSGDAIAYVGWIFVLDGAVFTLLVLAMRGRAAMPAGARAWGGGVLAAAASYGAYAISVWAMTAAPIALVAALRETSILFAVGLGWLVFGERMRPDKALAAALIVGGVVLTRL